MITKKTALITGINGQDGAYLSDLLLAKGYDVYGIVKRNSVAENQTYRIEQNHTKLNLEYGDMTDMASLVSVISKVQPDEIYNLAAQSHVRISFDQPIYTTQVDAVGVLNLLEAIRITSPKSKIYQASSSEMFGNSSDVGGWQRETTPLVPVSPYGCAKVFAHNICRNYRNSYGMFVSCGILFNHESPLRGTNFVTNKVVKEAVRIKLGLNDKLALGNLDASRDWGHAKDYVDAMWRIMQLDSSDDFVCATGESKTVKQLVEYVFGKLDLEWQKHVTIDFKYYRPEELNCLKGDATKLKTKTGWEPAYTFESMLDEMINYWKNHYDRN
jgi:GDPmannose 4,6-dehydratase